MADTGKVRGCFKST